MRASKYVGAALLAFMVTTGQAMAYDQEQMTRDPTPAEMFADAAVGRPLGLLAMAFGTAAFVVSLPFTLTSHSTDQAAKTLVREPTNYTFKRPLGRFISCEEQPDFCR
jgi:hypothetical protein